MDFSFACRELTLGKRLTRIGWNGKGMWIEVQCPDEHSKMTRPYIYICVPKGSSNQFGDDHKEVERIPWQPSQTDLFADDWVYYDELYTCH